MIYGINIFPIIEAVNLRLANKVIYNIRGDMQNGDINLFFLILVLRANKQTLTFFGLF